MRSPSAIDTVRLLCTPLNLKCITSWVNGGCSGVTTTLAMGASLGAAEHATICDGLQMGTQSVYDPPASNAGGFHNESRASRRRFYRVRYFRRSRTGEHPRQDGVAVSLHHHLGAAAGSIGQATDRGRQTGAGRTTAPGNHHH